MKSERVAIRTVTELRAALKTTKTRYVFVRFTRGQPHALRTSKSALRASLVDMDGDQAVHAIMDGDGLWVYPLT